MSFTEYSQWMGITAVCFGDSSGMGDYLRGAQIAPLGIFPWKPLALSCGNTRRIAPQNGVKMLKNSRL